MPSLIIRCCFFFNISTMHESCFITSCFIGCMPNRMSQAVYVCTVYVRVCVAFFPGHLGLLSSLLFKSVSISVSALPFPFTLTSLQTKKAAFFYYQIESFLLPPLLHAAYAKLCLFNENLLFDSQALSSQLQTAVQKMSLAR